MTSAVDLFFNKQEPFIYVSQFSHNETVLKHSHDFYEFVYIENGFSVHNHNEHFAILIPGDIFGMRPGDSHGYFNVRDSKIYNCLFYKEAIQCFLGKLTLLPGLKEIFENSIVQNKEQKKVHLDISMRYEISTILNKMQAECKNLRLGSELKLKALLIDFLVLMSRSYESSNKVKSCTEYSQTKRILTAIAYIEKNITRKIDIDELATLCDLSTDYFSKTFKSLCGLTPSDYILFLRISKASEMLLNSNLSVSSISSDAGFEDSNYFSRTFKKATGLSPVAFREKNNYF